MIFREGTAKGQRISQKIMKPTKTDFEWEQEETGEEGFGHSQTVDLR